MASGSTCGMKFPYFLLPLVWLAAPVAAEQSPQSVSQTATPSPDWAFEASDIPVDPAFRFGRLANGMRYIIRRNDRPEGTALVRLYVGSGSLSEANGEEGLAHFLEHMAFNGSQRVPEGEMVKLLEREGLAFGADTNASTGFEQTIYKLDLPRSDAKLLDTVLMLMRETASGLTIDPAAVDRERGVILSERRDRTNYAFKEQLERFAFLTPGARYTERLPIGTLQTLQNAGATEIRRFYEREYVPANTVLVVIGDFPASAVETAILEHFGSWAAAPLPAKPATGPIDLNRSGVTDIYLDPALSERVTMSSHAQWQDEPDTTANRRQKLLRAIGYGIVNRRLLSLARQDDPPFRGAGFGTGDIFEIGRTTNLVVDSADGEWKNGLEAAVLTLRRALSFGFTDAEVAEQVASTLSAQQNAAASADTRSNSALMAEALELVSGEQVPSTPKSALERLERFLPYISPAAVLAAVRDDAVPLVNPIIRFTGRTAPAGGTGELRAAWNSAMAAPIAPLEIGAQVPFAYSEFGTPGAVITDRLDSRLGIRELRFANGVMLNLKRTNLQQDRIALEVNVDGGSLLNTRQDPLATALVSLLPQGGLGKHSQDELQTILAGRSVSWTISVDADAFTNRSATTRRDLGLQLQLLAAGLTDPGYRKDAETRFRRNIANFFKQKDATPGAALSNALGGIISDNDPRFTLQPEESYMALDFAKLRSTIGDRLANGAIEIALVGDFDEDAAITLVASTFGALPPREAEFLPREDARQRSFTQDLSPRLLGHKGEKDQALLRLTWPTGDDSDLTQDARLKVLERVVRLELQDELRERLGKTYSPNASSDTSSDYRGFGTFAVAASIDVGDLEATRNAIAATLERLRNSPLDADTLERARKPLIDAYDNALKSNNGWMGLVDRAQSESKRIDRFLAWRAIVEAITPDDIRAVAAKFLGPDKALEVLVVPPGE